MCHAPSLKTRPDYPLAVLAGIDAPIYSDVLLHDMGDSLADGVAKIDGEATSRDWRTTPLIGLRFDKELMHDGRAKTVGDAIRAHAGPGSEANESVQIFDSMSPADQKALLDFVGAL